MPTQHPEAGKVAAAIARSQPHLLDALHTAARHQLASGAWLVTNPNERAGSTLWVRQPPHPDTQPLLVDRLVQARTTAHHLAHAAGPNPFPDAAAAVAVATARQGLPPRHAITAPTFPTTSTRPPAPNRPPSRSPDIER